MSYQGTGMGRVSFAAWCSEWAWPRLWGAGGGGMVGVRDEFRNKFNPLAAIEAQRYPPCGSDGAPRESNNPQGDESSFCERPF